MLGSDVDALLLSLGITKEQLLESDRCFPVMQLYRLYDLIADQTHTPDLGLYTGRITYIGGLNVQLYMSTICRTFRDYLNLIPSVLRFSGDIGEVRIQREGDFIRLEWIPLWAETSKQRFMSDELLSNSAAIVNSLCVQPIPVVKAHFTYSKPKDCSMLETIFGRDLCFDQPKSCLYFARESLDYPLTQLESNWNQALSLSIRFLFDDEQDDFLVELRNVILRLLPTADTHVDKVAAKLNISRRTLQRRLSERDTQFVQVLQGVRSDMAMQYLTDERLSITDIAFLLGYGDQGSFSSAFKVWHGVSPRDYRGR